MGKIYTADNFVKSSGTSSQFLKADGSVDSSTYALTSQLHDAVTLGTTGVLNGLSLSGQVLSLATASSTTRGALTAEDYSYFFGKQNALTNPVTGTGATNTVPKFTGTSAIGNSLIYDDGTNIGIGTTSPLSKLHIEGDNSSTTDETVLTLRGNGENGKRIDFRNAFGSLARITGTKLAGGASADEGILIFETAINSVLSEKMRITSGGNVGIGTTSPSQKLDVNGDIGTGGVGLNGSLKLKRSSDGAVINEISYVSATDELRLNNGSGSGNITFLTTSSERMRITSGGNVGIGTTSPGALLHVSKSLTSADNIKPTLNVNSKTDGNYSGGVIDFGQDASVNKFARIAGVRNDAAIDSQLEFSTNSDIYNGSDLTSIKMVIKGNGNVGIGTTSPIDKLNVAGGITSTGITDPTNTAIGSFQIGYDGTNGIIRTWNSSPLKYQSYNYQSWETMGSERMRITSGGNVGIGTLAPSKKLDVTGFDEDGIQYRTSTRTIGIGQTSGEPSLYWGSGTPLTFFSGSERMRITSGGNVGIGTTSPSVKLQVEGNSIINGVSGDDTLYLQKPTGATLAISGATGTTNKILIGGSNVTNPDMFVYVGGSERMRITSGGNVGIGTTSPLRKLTVTGSSGTTMIALENIGIDYYGIGMPSGSADMAFYSSASTERMRITSGGNVLIGTSTDAGYKLDVNGTGRISSYLDVNYQASAANGSLNIDSVDPTIRFRVSGGTANKRIYEFRAIAAGGTNDRLELRTWNDAQNAASSLLSITNGGNVGIGTTSPSTKLDVVGAITASGGFFNSDMRLKDLTDYDYNVSDIKPITYLWKDGRDNKKHVGYSAQEVQKVMPDAVNEGTDGMLSVNYVEVLVAQVNFLTKRIEELEKIVSK